MRKTDYEDVAKRYDGNQDRLVKARFDTNPEECGGSELAFLDLSAGRAVTPAPVWP